MIIICIKSYDITLFLIGNMMPASRKRCLRFVLCLPVFPFFCQSHSFCRLEKKIDPQLLFPLPRPENILIPWVWDATFDDILSRVEITIVPRKLCSFNESRWHRVVELFPHYSKAHFASGNQSNILVPFTHTLDFYLNVTHKKSNTTVEKKVHQKNFFKHMIGERFICVYFAVGRVLQLAATQSFEIQGSTAFMSMSVFQVICPVPKALFSFDEMILQRTFVWDDTRRILRRSSKSRRILEGVLTVTLDTVRFPVCRLSRMYQDLQLSRQELSNRNTSFTTTKTCSDIACTNVPSPTTKAKRNRLSYLYNLSICTVTNRASFVSAVEWIEYHRLVGVEHFFIYNTARRGDDLRRIFAAYTDEFLITLVEWPYENCAINMSSGRMFHYPEKNRFYQDVRDGRLSQQTAFKPPYCLAQAAALASCYARYRKTSKYMLLIDDDEFIVLRSRLTIGNKHTVINTSAVLNTSDSPVRKSLHLFADEYFTKHKNLGGLKFAPIVKSFCKLAKEKWENGHETATRFDGSLPRIGTWKHGRVGELNEGKLLLRTQMILSVAIHFFLQSEPGQKVNRQFFLVPYSEGVLLHYKHPPSAVGDIYGLNLNEPNTSLCSEFHRWGGFFEDIARPFKGCMFIMYDDENISAAPEHVRWRYEQWRTTADEIHPYVHSIYPTLKTVLMRKITMNKAIVPFLHPSS